jgi:hypothetical protein
VSVTAWLGTTSVVGETLRTVLVEAVVTEYAKVPVVLTEELWR